MTNQTTNQQQCFQHREDYKVQKLVERIEAKLALRAKRIAKPSKQAREIRQRKLAHRSGPAIECY